MYLTLSFQRQFSKKLIHGFFKKSLAFPAEICYTENRLTAQAAMPAPETTTGGYYGKEKSENGGRDHGNGRGFRTVVHRYLQKGRACLLYQCKGLYGHSSLRLCHLGKYTAHPGRKVQGNRSRERQYAHVHPGEPAPEGKGSRRGLCAGSGMGHLRRQ